MSYLLVHELIQKVALHNVLGDDVCFGSRGGSH
jgi:hypothetical protein